MSRQRRMHLDDAAIVRANGPLELDQLIEDAIAVDEAIESKITELALAGMSWAELGRLMGVTRQAVRERYMPKVDAWREVHGDVMPWDVRKWEQSVPDYTEEDGSPYAD